MPFKEYWIHGHYQCHAVLADNIAIQYPSSGKYVRRYCVVYLSNGETNKPGGVI